MAKKSGQKENQNKERKNVAESPPFLHRINDSKVLPPGEILKKLMEDRNMSEETLAAELKIKRSVLDDIINGKRTISEYLALDLEKAGFVSQKFWMDREAEYEEELKKERIAQISRSLFRRKEKE